MQKTKFILLNSIGMILIGSFVVSFTIEFIWMLVSGEKEIPISRLIFNFIVGLIIGSSLILLQLIIIKFKKKQLFGFMSGVVIIAAILAVIYVHTGLTTGNWNLDAKWLVIFLVVEILSLVLLFSWYKQVDLYNMKLENKKTALKSKEVR